MFEDKIEALNNSRSKATKKKAAPVAASENAKTTTSTRSYTPPLSVPKNNGNQNIDLNLLIKALQVVMYGEQEDEQEIDPSQLQVYTVADLQSMLGASRPAIYELISKRQFPCLKVGTGYKIPKKAFHQWLNSQYYSGGKNND